MSPRLTRARFCSNAAWMRSALSSSFRAILAYFRGFRCAKHLAIHRLMRGGKFCGCSCRASARNRYPRDSLYWLTSWAR